VINSYVWNIVSSYGRDRTKKSKYTATVRIFATCKPTGDKHAADRHATTRHLLGLAARHGPESHRKPKAILDGEEESRPDPRQPFTVPSFEQGLVKDVEIRFDAFESSGRHTTH
jgi:hypothetical protein